MAASSSSYCPPSPSSSSGFRSPAYGKSDFETNLSYNAENFDSTPNSSGGKTNQLTDDVSNKSSLDSIKLSNMPFPVVSLNMLPDSIRADAMILVLPDICGNKDFVVVFTNQGYKVLFKIECPDSIIKTHQYNGKSISYVLKSELVSLKIPDGVREDYHPATGDALTLRSSDNQDIYVAGDYTMYGFMEKYANPSFKEVVSNQGVIPFEKCNSTMIAYVIAYVMHKHRYDGVVTEKVPDFYINPQQCKELLYVSSIFEV
jgi:hypothetical protein